MKIVLIRHGQTAGNALGRYIGATDEPLSEEGLLKARAVTPDLSIETVYVTPLLRTVQTASILFPQAERVIVPGLREMDFGAFENRSWKDMENDVSYRAWVDSGCLLPCPGGESMESFSRRVGAAFTKLLREHETEETLTLVVHGGTIMAVMYLFAAEKRAYYEWQVKNLEGFSVTAVPRPDGSFLLTGINPVQR